nr:hypothetical protein Iba_chr03fCG1100 [Ipomoea batatas]
MFIRRYLDGNVQASSWTAEPAANAVSTHNCSPANQSSQLLLILSNQLLQLLHLLVFIVKLLLALMLDGHSTFQNAIFSEKPFGLLLQHHIFLKIRKDHSKKSMNSPRQYACN